MITTQEVMSKAVARTSYAQDQVEVKPHMYAYSLIMSEAKAKVSGVEVLLDLVCKSTFNHQILFKKKKPKIQNKSQQVNRLHSLGDETRGGGGISGRQGNNSYSGYALCGG